MSKKILVVTLMTLLLPATLWAESATVTTSCALEGNHGLEVCFDSTSVAYVGQNFLTDTKTLKAEFVLDPRSIVLDAGEAVWLLTGIGPNPNPGIGICSNTAFVRTFRVRLFRVASVSDALFLQGLALGNNCGLSATPRIPLPQDQASRVCMDWASGQFRLKTGHLRFAVVPADQDCPIDLCSCADSSKEVNNFEVKTSSIRLGAPELGALVSNPPNDRVCIDDVSLDWSSGTFQDDFESGDTTAWSIWVPGGNC